MSDEQPSCVTEGHCSVHNVEIERRKNQTKLLAGLKNEIEHNQGEIQSLFRLASNYKAFMAQAKVVGIIALGIYIGSFTYTYQHKQEAVREFDKYHRLLNQVNNKMAIASANQAVMDQKFISLLEKIETTNDQLSIIIENMHLAEP